MQYQSSKCAVSDYPSAVEGFRIQSVRHQVNPIINNLNLASHEADEGDGSGDHFPDI